MYVEIKKLERRGIKVQLKDGFLSVFGTKPLPQSTQDHVDAITSDMDFSGRERDELMDHVANTSIWSTLKQLSD